MHILVLTDRDWTHPQGGGTGTNLFGQISRWLAWGHRVTVVACSYPGAPAEERIGNLTIHRMGGRATVFPRAIWKVRRGLVPDADVVLEVVNGITFLTPLWLNLPRLTLIHHVHREHYAQELGRLGRIAAFLLETAPLKWLYAGSRFQTLSRAEAEKIAEHGIDLDRIDVNYIGVEAGAFAPGERAAEPTLLYLGRLKKYKRIELLLDALEAIPGAVLDIAGEGDHRPDLEAEIERRGLGDRVRMHGHVSEERKTELYARAWVNLTASSAEGWCLAVMEAAACGTPSVALAVGGLPESIDDGRTGLLAHDDDELAEKVRAVVSDPAERDRLGANALERSQEFTWDAAAQRSLDALAELREHGRTRCRSAPARALRHRTRGRARGRRARGQRGRAHLHDRLRADPRHLRLRHARRARLDVPDPPGAGLGAADHGRARRLEGDRARPRGTRRGREAMAPARGDHHGGRRDGGGGLPRADRGGDRRRGGVGRGGHAADRLPVAARVDRTRRPPGVPALPRGRPEPGRRGRGAAHVRPDPRGHRTGRDRRLPGHGAVRARHGAGAGDPAAAGAPAHRGTGPARAPAPLPRPRGARVGPRRRPRPASDPPGDPRDRGEARGDGRRRRCLRRSGRRGQGDHLGGGGPRPLPAARGRTATNSGVDARPVLSARSP